MSEEDRIAYLAGETGVFLDPAELAEMEKIRIALADEASWVEPNASLEQRIIDAVAADVASARSHPAETSTPPSQPAVVTHIAHHRSRRMLRPAASLPRSFSQSARGRPGRGSFRPRRRTVASRRPTGHSWNQCSGTARLTQTERLADSRQATGLPPGQRVSTTKHGSGPAGVIVSGTFNGHGCHAAGARPTSSFPTLTITRQTVGGGPASSGQVVLLGTTQPDQ
jgi:hypothetical protein